MHQSKMVVKIFRAYGSQSRIVASKAFCFSSYEMTFRVRCHTCGYAFTDLNLPQLLYLLFWRRGQIPIMLESTLDYPNSICLSAFDKSESFKRLDMGRETLYLYRIKTISRITGKLCDIEI